MRGGAGRGGLATLSLSRPAAASAGSGDAGLLLLPLYSAKKAERRVLQLYSREPPSSRGASGVRGRRAM